MTLHDDNRRAFTRIPIQVKAEVRCEPDTLLTGAASDLSLNGLFLGGAKSVAVGTRCDVRLMLDTGSEGGVSIDASGQITRSGVDGVAVTFDQIDADSFDHLRNLVLYNSPDPDRVSDEFLESLGIKRRS